jgi:hypothetical protein
MKVAMSNVLEKGLGFAIDVVRTLYLGTDYGHNDSKGLFVGRFGGLTALFGIAISNNAGEEGAER